MFTSTSPEVIQMQKQQEQARDSLGDAIDRHSSMTEWQRHPEVIACQRAYDDTVERLVQMLGENAHCNLVDIELYSSFSDLHSSRRGCRPRQFVNRMDCRAYIENESCNPYAKE